jgi:hypothetical protein
MRSLAAGAGPARTTRTDHSPSSESRSRGQLNLACDSASVPVALEQPYDDHCLECSYFVYECDGTDCLQFYLEDGL